jgi:hypothetical protein
MTLLKRSLLVLAVLPLCWVSAQAADDGNLNAVSYDPMPLSAGTALSLRLYDDSAENVALLRSFESELQKRGYIVSNDAPLVLNIETRNEIGAWASGDRKTLLELQGRVGSGSGSSVQGGYGYGSDEGRARLNLMDSARGGVFNEGNDNRTAIVTPSTHRLDLSIDDRRDGKHLWQGWAVANAGAGRGNPLQALVPIMVGAIGKTVKQEPFAFTKQ